MISCHHLDELPSLGAPLHLALGVFDGVHTGHQAVIARVVEAAARDGGLAGVLTFDPHPIRVIAPEKAPSSLLATLGHKAHIVESLGAGLFVALPFDAEMAAMEAGDFLNALLKAPVRTIAVGEDWRFGRGRHGDIDFLTEQAALRGFKLEAVAPVMVDGDRASSTRIRQAIRDGNLDAAARLLGRPYTVCGPVAAGRQLGRTIGFPTANIATGDVQLPPEGVWVVRATLGGRQLKGVANLGTRPTVDGGARTLEVHLFDFSEDIYGRELGIEFLHFLRPELKFNGLDELKARIAEDARLAREFP